MHYQIEVTHAKSIHTAVVRSRARAQELPRFVPAACARCGRLFGPPACRDLDSFSMVTDEGMSRTELDWILRFLRCEVHSSPEKGFPYLGECNDVAGLAGTSSASVRDFKTELRG